MKVRVPPHNEETERAVLGALLVSREAINTAAQYLESADFYSPANALIYSAITSLYNDSAAQADVVTVSERLRKQGTLERVGGEPYIASLSNVVPTAANIEFYAKVVRDLSLRRIIIATAGTLAEDAYNESIDITRLLDEAQRRILALSDRSTLLKYASAAEVMPEFIGHVENLWKRSDDACTGVPSGFPKLDELTSGFQESEMIVLGARPSVGKTAMALNMAVHAAVHKNFSTAFFSLEMSNREILARIMAAEAGIDSKRFRSHFKPTVAEQAMLMDSAERVGDAPFYFCDSPNMRLQDLRSLSRRLKLEEDVKIIFIDYLQLITTEGYERQPEFEKFSMISRSIKQLARELKIPIVTLSQLAREAQNNKPTLANLRGSGSIEQDADVVMLLHREKNTEAQGEDDKFKFTLQLEKQRNGSTDEIEVGFKRQFTRFFEIEREREG